MVDPALDKPLAIPEDPRTVIDLSKIKTPDLDSIFKLISKIGLSIDEIQFAKKKKTAPDKSESGLKEAIKKPEPPLKSQTNPAPDALAGLGRPEIKIPPNLDAKFMDIKIAQRGDAVFYRIGDAFKSYLILERSENVDTITLKLAEFTIADGSPDVQFFLPSTLEFKKNTPVPDSLKPIAINFSELDPSLLEDAEKHFQPK